MAFALRVFFFPTRRDLDAQPQKTTCTPSGNVTLPRKRYDFLTGAKRWEWVGCWGLLGCLLLVMKWIIPENSLRLAPVSFVYMLLFSWQFSMANPWLPLGYFFRSAALHIALAAQSMISPETSMASCLMTPQGKSTLAFLNHLGISNIGVSMGITMVI